MGSTRRRFEIFKRDDFTCQYCGRRSPDVVLEVDHIVPQSSGGSDDVVNLITSCWECNRGKSDVPLAQIVTGEDPHDRAIEILERQRQLEEYNRVLAQDRERREDQAWDLVRYWREQQGYLDDELEQIGRQDFAWLVHTLRWCPIEIIRQFMDVAVAKDLTHDLRYVGGCVKNWRVEHRVGSTKDDI